MMMNTLFLIMAETLLTSASDTARAMMVKSCGQSVPYSGIFRSSSKQGTRGIAHRVSNSGSHHPFRLGTLPTLG